MKHRIGAILVYLVVALLGLSAIPKFLNLEPIQVNFARWHLTDYRLLIAILETGTVILLLYPRTYVWGLLAASGYLGGAIVTHMTAGEPLLMGPDGPGSVMPATLLALLWLGAWLKRPSLFDV